MLNAEKTLLSLTDEPNREVPDGIQAAMDGLSGSAAKVSVLAHYLLDASLMFIKPPAASE